MAENIPPQDGAQERGELYHYDKLDDKMRDKKTRRQIEKLQGEAPPKKPRAKKPTPAAPVEEGDPALKPLSHKQKLFVYHYTRHGNATKAAAQAGYDGDRGTLASIGSENLKKPNVALAIGDVMGECGMGEREFCALVAQRARSSMEPFLYGDPSAGDDPNSETLPGEAPKVNLGSEEARLNAANIKKLKTRTTVSIKEDDANEHVEVELEVYDALPALKMVGDMLGKTGRGRPTKALPVQGEPGAGSGGAPPAATPEQARVELAKILGLPVEMLPPVTR